MMHIFPSLMKMGFCHLFAEYGKNNSVSKSYGCTEDMKNPYSGVGVFIAKRMNGEELEKLRWCYSEEIRLKERVEAKISVIRKRQSSLERIISEE